MSAIVRVNGCRMLPVVVLSFAAVLSLATLVAPSATSAAEAKPEIVSIAKIWDRAGHNAFPDLIRFKGKWFCTFREADGHIRGDGKICVIESTDGKTWTSAALLEEKGIDLRDPKFSITPDGRLMMVFGGSDYAGTNLGTNSEGAKPALKSMEPRVAFSADGHAWTPPRPVLRKGVWLWRVTWHDGKAYGTAYGVPSTDGKTASPSPQPGEWTLDLVVSSDGLKWETLRQLDVPGKPNETTLRFTPEGEMIALVRRDKNAGGSWIGTSKAPYQAWSWKEARPFVGGPNFIILPDGTMWGGGRDIANESGKAKTMLARMTRDSYEPVLMFPSGGDNSYPGFVYHDGLLWMAYYSSHEGKTDMYLAKIKLPEASGK